MQFVGMRYTQPVFAQGNIKCARHCCCGYINVDEQVIFTGNALDAIDRDARIVDRDIESAYAATVDHNL